MKHTTRFSYFINLFFLIDGEKKFLNQITFSSFIEILAKLKLDWYFNQEFCVDKMLSIITNNLLQVMFTFSEGENGELSNLATIVKIDLL